MTSSTPTGSGFHAHLAALGELTGADTSSWDGYLDALRSRRAAFVAAGATASDHGHPTPATADLSPRDAADLFARIAAGKGRPGDAELFRGQMLVEMAAMSLDDGLVLQIHAGAWRDHNPTVAARFGPDQGADIPTRVDYVGGLKPLLDRFGNEPRLTIVVYTLDESTYGRELAPLAGHYPALRLGPPWWFFDSPDGIKRFYHSVVETAGFANTVGFNDDARSLLSIPARHDVARRLQAGYLAGSGGRAPPGGRGRGRHGRRPRLQPGAPGLRGRDDEDRGARGPDGVGKVDRGRARGAAHRTGARRCGRRHHRAHEQDRPGALGGGWRGRLPVPRIGRGARGPSGRHADGPGRPGRGRARSRRTRRPRRQLRRLAPDQPVDVGRTGPPRRPPPPPRRPAGREPSPPWPQMRSELYRQVATTIIDTDDRAPETIADEVVGLLARRPEDG